MPIINAKVVKRVLEEATISISAKDFKEAEEFALMLANKDGLILKQSLSVNAVDSMDEISPSDDLSDIRDEDGKPINIGDGVHCVNSGLSYLVLSKMIIHNSVDQQYLKLIDSNDPHGKEAWIENSGFVVGTTKPTNQTVSQGVKNLSDRDYWMQTGDCPKCRQGNTIVSNGGVFECNQCGWRK